MSSKRPALLHRRAALLGLVMLGGCGFTPVYAPGGVGDVLQNNVSVAGPETVTGFVMRQRLVDRLGRADAPRFQLTTSLTTRRAAATITSGGDTTRFDVTGVARWELLDSVTGVAETGQVQTFSSYSTTGSTVATQTAEADAERRLATALADLMVTQLIARVGQQ